MLLNSNDADSSDQSEPLVDFSYVTELAGNKPDFIAQVLSIFMENTPDQMKKLEELVEAAQDWEQISAQAHLLKSSVGVVKIRGMADRLQQIETIAREGKDLPFIRDTMRKLVTDFADAEVVIRKKMAESGS